MSELRRLVKEIYMKGTFVHELSKDLQPRKFISVQFGDHALCRTVTISYLQMLNLEQVIQLINQEHYSLAIELAEIILAEKAEEKADD